jgi:hypothetical protein
MSHKIFCFILLWLFLSHIHTLIDFQTVEELDSVKNSIPTLVLSVYTKACNVCSVFEEALQAIEYNIRSEKFKTGKLLFDDQFESKYEDLIAETGMIERRDDVPMLLVFRYGQGSTYAGPSKGEAMQNYFILEANSLHVNEINSVEAKHKVMDALDMTQVIAYLDKKQNAKAFQAYSKFSHILRGKARVSVITKAEIAQTYG